MYTVTIYIMNSYNEAEYWHLFASSSMRGAAAKATRWLHKGFGRSEVSTMRIVKRGNAQHKVWEIR